MKKELKASVKCTTKEQIPARFYSALTNEVRKADWQWMLATNYVLLAARSPPLVRRAMRTPDPIDRARRLEAWAELAREAIRKIVKKYNKWYGPTCGVMGLNPEVNVGFIRSCSRIETEALARSREQQDTSLEEGLTCPVCLDTVTQPVAAACGHPMCRACFMDLKKHARNHRGWSQCPLCRNRVGRARSLPHLQSLAIKHSRAVVAHSPQETAVA